MTCISYLDMVFKAALDGLLWRFGVFSAAIFQNELKNKLTINAIESIVCKLLAIIFRPLWTVHISLN